MQKYFAKSPISFIHLLRRIMQLILYLVSKLLLTTQFCLSGNH